MPIVANGDSSESPLRESELVEEDEECGHKVTVMRTATFRSSYTVTVHSVNIDGAAQKFKGNSHDRQVIHSSYIVHVLVGAMGALVTWLLRQPSLALPPCIIDLF
ncbi:hypothetical protein F5148DRAFT_1287504 [Russula earlei]|uniref:Uncharacterized protein n=1 Tax=Russula earlei TaxID=71964 RepID=A0ACC0U3D2_9AGAM|nr:hypothetical protein F5148DRAFT_1287504 [Russula earlei]